MDQIMKIFFESVKKVYEGYYVEYVPPHEGFPFAHISVTFMGKVPEKIIINTMEEQASFWYKKYPIPVMISSFDSVGNLIKLNNKNFGSIIAFDVNGKIKLHWESLKNDEIPDIALDREYLKSIYTDIKYKAQADIDKSIQEQVKGVKALKTFVIIWAVAIPAVIAILEFYSPAWVAALALTYSLWKAFQKYLQLTGRVEASDKEKTEEEKKRKMEHYYYHCERNPEAFERLKSENFKEDSKNRIIGKYQELQEAR